MTEPRMGTRWGRASTGIAAGFCALGAMAAVVVTGAFGINANLVIQNGNLSFSSGKMHAEDAGFGMVPVKRQDGTWVNVLRAGFADATLDGLCLSRTESVGPLGSYTIKITAGDGDASTFEISAQNAAFDLSNLRGTSIVLGGTAQIGLATSDITTIPGTAPFDSNPFGAVPSGSSPLTTFGSGGPYNATANGGMVNGQGYTGIDVTVADLTNVYGVLQQAQISGNIKLPRLSIAVLPGSQPCAPAPPTANGTFPH